MRKISKIGLSALCGSLAAISSASAGTLDVTGTAEATWTNVSNGVTGNPIGMNTGLSFTGNGELDGGQTFSVTIAQTDKAAYSSANITLNTNSLGTFKLSSAEGSGGIGGYDDNMPRAWEEVWDTAIATNANFQKGVGSSTNLSWKSPVVMGSSIQIAYAPDNDGAQNNNKGVSGAASDEFGAGWDVVLDFGAGAPVNLFIGASETEQSDFNKKDQGLENLGEKHHEAVVGLQFSFGPLQAGAQVSAERLRTQSKDATSYYGNSSWGIALNVNDNLSISYSEARHLQTKTRKNSATDGAGGLASGNQNTQKSWMRGDSIQIAYTIGGIGLKYADSTYDNTAWGFDTAPTPKESRIIAVSLAF